MKTGLLLLNLGTPDSPEPRDVGRYLRQFLMDPYVIDIPWPLRWFLVNVLIVPRRSHDSAELYRKIWNERGSPLRYIQDDLVEKVRKLLGPSFAVVSGMRYGEPSLPTALNQLKAQGIDRLLVAPLYPQYSLAATESSLVETRRALRETGLDLRPVFLPPFYDRPEFLDSFAETIQRTLKEKAFTAQADEMLLFSFHGLPERQVTRTDKTGQHCLKSQSCCDRIVEANRDCYRAQCFATARELGKRLGLRPDQYRVCFQSRLGRTPWIRPYSDELYIELPKQGIRRIAVACPAFVTDCLETLEEVAMRGKESFIESGGKDLFLIPSLNSDDQWASTLAAWARHDFASTAHAQ